MDTNEARSQMAQAQTAFHDAGRPRLPIPVAGLSAVLAGAGIGLAGQPIHGAWHAVQLLGSIVLLALAFAVPNGYRKQHGLFGYRGRAKSDNVVFLVVAVALVVIALDTTRTLGLIYLGLAAIAAVTYFLVLRGRFGTTR